MSWDKKLAEDLHKKLSTLEDACYNSKSCLEKRQEIIGAIIGLVAEHRQVADLSGYSRGYDNGFADGRIRDSQVNLATNDPFS